MFHHLLVIWFEFVRGWHYLGIAVLMTLESTVFPIPSEVVVPPAAYWASQGEMNFWGIIAIGTMGSYLGSVISYGAAFFGRPLLEKYGKYILLTPRKLRFAETWVAEYGLVGIFLARMLPVIRHIISLPAGVLRMNFWRFSVATLLGSLLWCGILAWFGHVVIGNQPTLLQDPAVMVHVIRDKVIYIVLAVVVLGVTYLSIHHRMKRH